MYFFLLTIDLFRFYISSSVNFRNAHLSRNCLFRLNCLIYGHVLDLGSPVVLLPSLRPALLSSFSFLNLHACVLSFSLSSSGVNR